MHLEAAFDSQHGAAAGLLDQSALDGGSLAKTNTIVQVPGPRSKHSPSKCQRQRRARTLVPPLTRSTEQPQVCSISLRLMAAPLQRQTQTCKCLVLVASTLPSKTV